MQEQTQNETLQDAASAYILRDPNMTTGEIAEKLGLGHAYKDRSAQYGCCLYKSGILAAIRTSKETIVLFHLFHGLRPKLTEIAMAVTE